MLARAGAKKLQRLVAETGATAEACAACLRQAGGDAQRAWTLLAGALRAASPQAPTRSVSETMRALGLEEEPSTAAPCGSAAGAKKTGPKQKRR
jgi:hypothetical protein